MSIPLYLVQYEEGKMYSKEVQQVIKYFNIVNKFK